MRGISYKETTKNCYCPVRNTVNRNKDGGRLESLPIQLEMWQARTNINCVIQEYEISCPDPPMFPSCIAPLMLENDEYSEPREK